MVSLTAVTVFLDSYRTSASGPFSAALSHGSVDAPGIVTKFDRFEAPYASMVHAG